MKQVEIDGKSIPDGTTVSVDHVVQEFSIKIRSLTGVKTSFLKKYLQNRWEVLDIAELDEIQYVRVGSVDLF